MEWLLASRKLSLSLALSPSGAASTYSSTNNSSRARKIKTLDAMFSIFLPLALFLPIITTRTSRYLSTTHPPTYTHKQPWQRIKAHPRSTHPAHTMNLVNKVPMEQNVYNVFVQSSFPWLSSRVLGLWDFGLKSGSSSSSSSVVPFFFLLALPGWMEDRSLLGLLI